MKKFVRVVLLVCLYISLEIWIIFDPNCSFFMNNHLRILKVNINQIITSEIKDNQTCTWLLQSVYI